MKKKVLAGLLASMSLMSLVVGSTGAFAAGGDGTTDVTVGFTNHDPGTGDGDLELTYKPIVFDFGKTNAITTTSFNLTGERYVVVKDDRASAASNVWKLTAGLSDLVDAGANKLEGAKLTFAGEVKGYDESKGAPEAPNAITAKGARTAVSSALTGGGLEAGGAAQTVMIDQDASGAFKGSTALELTGINLTVPTGKAIAGSVYEGTVTWTLADAI